MKGNTMAKRINTTWTVRTYDVWGNAKDGYDVNDVFTRGSSEPVSLKVTCNNQGTPAEFLSASPTDTDIRRMLGVSRIGIDTDGDDTTIYVTRKRDGYPMGELKCISHSSLSPIEE